METLIVCGFRAARSLFTPGMLGVLVASVIITVLALMAFITGSGIFFSWLSQQPGMPMASLLPWLGGIGASIIAWFLFPGIMPIFIGFFDERITRLIERHDYPDMPPQAASRFWPELLHDIRFSLMAILLNILVLPLYLLPVVNLFLFYVLNGYLLGREFFTTVARRHVPLPQAEALRRRYGRTIMAAGMMLALLATIPVVNLFAPFWGIAVMVHLYQRLKGSEQEILPFRHTSPTAG